MKTMIVLTVGALMLAGSAALALTTQEVVDSFAARGFTRIEVKSGPTQMKVEAIRGMEKVEVVYDSASGAVLKTETEAVEAGDDTSPGVEVRTLGRDFLDRDDRTDDSADDEDGDGDKGRGRGRGRGRGGDDDDRDDDHGDHGGDDRGGDDD